MTPVPRPTATPHNSTSCQDWCIAGEAATAAALRTSATVIVRLTPKRSIKAAANGPIKP